MILNDAFPYPSATLNNEYDNNDDGDDNDDNDNYDDDGKDEDEECIL